jgi:hypothetical protein
MKRTSYGALTIALVVVVALAALSLAGGSRVRAQDEERQFKVGDRVEIDTFMRSNPQDPANDKIAVWRKGTVVRLHNPEEHFGSYVVKLDNVLPIKGKPSTQTEPSPARCPRLLLSPDCPDGFHLCFG